MNTLKKSYELLIILGKSLRSPILLLCRLYWGYMFLMAGLGKLADIEHTAASFASLNIVAPHFMAYLVAIVEFVGGFCLMIGLASRLVAIPLAITMIVAYFTAHVDGLRSIFSQPSLFVAEAPFNFLLVCLLVLAFGPGRFSVDYLLEKWVFHKA